MPRPAPPDAPAPAACASLEQRWTRRLRFALREGCLLLKDVVSRRLLGGAFEAVVLPRGRQGLCRVSG